jgi:hypothetical protein
MGNRRELGEYGMTMENYRKVLIMDLQLKNKLQSPIIFMISPLPITLKNIRNY